MSPRKKPAKRPPPSIDPIGIPPRLVQAELLQVMAPEKPEKAKAAPPPDDPADPHRAPVVDADGPLASLLDLNFLQFASYTICQRAIPAVEDGLKPVQRRILHALHDKDDGRFIKVANVVGHTMQYHPHGDASIGDALVNLTNKRFLIEGQGNFGNLYTGDRAAAPRYIECRLTDLARKEVFNTDLTEFVPSYDGRNKEPVTFPCKLPLLLMLGAEGIATGMATRIMPHNFGELIEAMIAILRKKPFEVLPDFPNGGMMDVTRYDDGVGKISMRARIGPRDDNKLVITELAHGTTTESLTASIEDAIKKKKIPVRSISDFTAEKVEIELTLTPGATATKAIQALYAFTTCEGSITSNIVVIRDKRPVEMRVSEILEHNTARLLDVLKRELELKERNLEEGIHSRTLVQIFVEERIYKRIEECKTYEAVKQAIYDGLEPFTKKLYRPVSDKDVEMLLSVRIRRISLFDISKNRKEIEDLMAELAKVRKQLAQPVRHAVRYLKGLLKTYGALYPRRTEVTTFSSVEVRKLTASELSIKKDADGEYIGSAIAGDALLECSSLDKLLLVWDDGRYKVVPPPEKLFVDKNLLYCAIFDRDKVMTAVYQHDHLVYMKRFTFGGTIMNRDYRIAPDPSQVLLFSDRTPADVYVKYKPAKGQRIHQQLFHPGDIPVKGAKARGNQMTAKRISRLVTERPRWWKDDGDTPKGVLFQK